MMLRSLTTLISLLAALATQTSPARPVPPASASATSLFDGRTLAGWEGDTRVWRVANGAITGGSMTVMTPDNVFLASTREYADFVLRVSVRLRGRDGFINSGIQIRSQRMPNSTEMIGYQCDLGDPEYWGSVYDESRRDRTLSPSNMAIVGPALHRDDWNEYVIRAEGPRITTWLNGVLATDYHETDANIPRSGRLGIQVHGGGTTLVEIRRVTIETLPPRP